MKFGIALHSIIPVRKEPREQAEMTSQLLFGECYTVKGTSGSWIEIIAAFDQYRGWIDNKLHQHIDEQLFNDLLQQSPPVSGALITTISSAGSPQLHIPAGSSLTGLTPSGDLLQIGQLTYHIHQFYGKACTKSRCTLAEAISLYLNAPYLWGGRTPFGCDCSGFVQSVYKILGIPIARDAWQQANLGQCVENLSVAVAGDLAFFSNNENKITHVGILLDPDTIVHCSGYVHKNPVNDNGIFQPETGYYTHRLFSIRRILR